MRKKRVVIIGAGITGSLCAWRLARAGWDVTILEALHPGAGSSSRTAAGIRQQFSTPATVVGMRYSVDFYKNFAQNVGGSSAAIVQNGYLFLHGDQDQWQAATQRVRLQQKYGLTEVAALEGQELQKRFPWVDGLSMIGGTWCPSDGFLHPQIVYQEALEAAVLQGARLVQQAPVQGAEGNIDTVHTPKGSFSADLFIDATNAWSPRLARILGALELPIQPLKRYLWMLERSGSLSEDAFRAMPLVISPSGAYCRPENNGSLLMGWAHHAPPEPDFSYEDQDRIEPDFFHRSGPDSYGYATWASLAEAIPALGEFAGITATTSGYYATTPDHNPFLDYDPLVPNLIRLSGFSGHGAMFGPFSALVGQLLAEQGRCPMVDVMGHSISLSDFQIDREFHEEAMVI